MQQYVVVPFYEHMLFITLSRIFADPPVSITPLYFKYFCILFFFCFKCSAFQRDYSHPSFVFTYNLNTKLRTMKTSNRILSNSNIDFKTYFNILKFYLYNSIEIL